MTLQKRSFIAGLLYISLAIIGPFAFMVIPSLFGGAGGINAYAVDHVGIIVLWFFIEVIIIVIEVILTIYLWKIFDTYNKDLSLVAFILRMTMIGVMIINALFLLILAINGGTSATTYIAYHEAGVYIWQLFFSGHVFLLGYMVFMYLKTNWRYLGLIVILGSIGYLLDSINHLLAVETVFLLTLGTILLVFVTLGEIGMAVGLLLKKLLA